jgi:hypothetical protein
MLNFFCGILPAILLLTGPAAGSADDEAAGDAPETAPVVRLRDQFREHHEIAFPRAKPVVFGIADQHSYQYAEKWYDALKDDYTGRVDLIGIAALDDFFFLWKPWLKWYMRSHVDEPILLDWKDRAAEDFGFRPRTLCIYIVSPAGGIQGRFYGAATPEKRAAFRECLDTLLKSENENPDTGPNGDEEQDAESSKGEKDS